MDDPTGRAVIGDGAQPRLRAESGFSLIEVLMAVVVMGIAFVGLLSAMGTSVVAAGVHRTQAVAELEVRRYAELVDAATYDATYTAASVDYTDPPSTPPFTFTPGTPSVVNLDAAGAPTTFASSTHQIVTVSVRSTDGKVEESIQVVKRKPT